jgi:hypothetical protein
MTDSERQALFLALRGPVDSIRDPAVVRQLEDIAAGQLWEIEPVMDNILRGRELQTDAIEQEGGQ